MRDGSNRARNQAQDAASYGHFPLSAWLGGAIGCSRKSRGRCMSSRGRFNPRGVKREISNFNVRHRGEPIQQRRQPTPVLRI